MQIAESNKRKPGPPRDPNAKSESLERVRRFNDRKSTEAMVESVAVAAAGAAARALTPRDTSDEVQQLIATSAAEVSRILTVNGPSIIQALVDRAIGGDTNAAALLTKYIVSPKTKIKLETAPGATLEEFADSIIAQTVAGSLSIEDGESFLRLAERHSALSLNAGLVQRLAALNEQLAEARERNVIAADVTLTRKPIPLEQFIEMQRAKS